MRKTAKHAHGVRYAGAVLGIAGVVAGTVLFGAAGTAAAATTASQCTGSVSGPVGDSLRLASSSVKGYVVQSVDDGVEAPLLGVKNEQTRMREAFEAGKFEPIPLPAIPNAASATLSGDAIAKAVLARLDKVDEVKDIMQNEGNRARITDKVSDSCGLTVKATNYSAGTSPTTSAPTARSGGDTQPTTAAPAGDGERATDPAIRYGRGARAIAPSDYGTLPFSTTNAPGQTAPPPADLFRNPGLSDDFGVLGDAGGDTSVQQAGNAEALGARQAAVPLPVVIAVVTLAGSAAALVRTWVLRRTAGTAR